MNFQESRRIKELTVALVILGGVGLVTSALLISFGVLETAETEIEQSVLVNGEALSSEDSPVLLFGERDERKVLRAGNTFSGTALIENRADVIAPIDFITSEDGNYQYERPGVRYDYILLERLGSGGEVIHDGDSYTSEGSYSFNASAGLESEAENFLGSGDISGPVFTLEDSERYSGSIQDLSIKVDYRIGSKHEYDRYAEAEDQSVGVVAELDSVLMLDGSRVQEPKLVEFIQAEPGSEIKFSEPIIYDGQELVANASVQELGDDFTVERLGVFTGYLDFSSRGNYNLIFEEIELESEELVSNRVVIPDESGHSERIIVSENSENIFAASLRSSVFMDPDLDSHYQLKTTLAVPEGVRE